MTNIYVIKTLFLQKQPLEQWKGSMHVKDTLWNGKKQVTQAFKCKCHLFL